MKHVFLAGLVIVLSTNDAFSVPMMDLKPLDLVERGCVDKRKDCHWITDNHYDVAKYCLAHRNDAFIKDCPRFCGFCNVRAPAPPVVSTECKDKRDDCHWITDNHYDVTKYCWAHRHDAFIKDCPRFCGFCNVRAPAPPVVSTGCVDKRDDCHWITDHHHDVAKYCWAHRHDAFIKDCPRFCGFCNVRAPAPPAVVRCVDTRSDCNWILKQRDPAKYCHQYRNDPQVRKCARTCGFCHYRVPAPAHQSHWMESHSACVDTRSDCDTINHIGEPKASYCHRLRNDPAVRECPKTCGFC